jgi:hemolysin III
MNSATCPISGESVKEERMNALTHFFGFLFSLAGLCYLLFISIPLKDNLKLISSLIYGSTLVLLYAASTFYHKSQCLKKKERYKILDHSCIYLLIAGTYTPFTLGPLMDFGGLNVMAVEWMIAIVGISIKIIAVHRFKIISLLAYLTMGWLCIFNIDILIDQLSSPALALLIAGGLSYTLGTLFYLWDSLPYNHTIWHLFVLAGSACHYFCILCLI